MHNATGVSCEYLKLILPHHALYRHVGLVAVFGIFLLVVFYFYLTIYREVDKLADRHALVYFYGLLYRYFQCPVAAEAYIAFTGSGVDVNTQAAC